MLISELDDESFAMMSGKKTEYNEITNEIIGSFEKKLTKTKKSSIVGIEKYTVEEETDNEPTTSSTTSSN